MYNTMYTGPSEFAYPFSEFLAIFVKHSFLKDFLRILNVTSRNELLDYKFGNRIYICRLVFEKINFWFSLSKKFKGPP